MEDAEKRRRGDAEIERQGDRETGRQGDAPGVSPTAQVTTGFGQSILAELSAAGLDSVEGAFAYGLGQDLDKPGLEHRRRTRLEITDAKGISHELYLKRYEDEGFGRKMVRLLTYGSGKSPGTCEFDNIVALRAAGATTMQEVICGQRGGLFSRCRSYVIVTAVPGRSLEKCADELLASDPAAGLALAVKLGRLAAKLHGHGFVHRDFYACHIFVNRNSEGYATETQRAQREEKRRERGDDFDLYLIDLARVFRPRWRKFRWRVKDLAQLKYSMPVGWVKEQWGHFLEGYLEALEEHCPVRAGCKQRGSGIRAATHEHDAREVDNAIDRKVAWMVRRAAARLSAAGERSA
jgi:hypothetical protein